MEVAETKCSSAYGKPPWIFKGSALYQLHLVKAETARAFIPKELRLVEAFGYTLGGFFLASYEDSPVGVFDELVVIAATIWNPPTSCAWAARVLVSSKDACNHGRKDVGLPSQVARFSKRTSTIPKEEKGRVNHYLNTNGLGTAFSSPREYMDVQVTETSVPAAADVCNINLTTLVPGLKFSNWGGPSIKMSLPSFSGRTEYNPNLLKYSCNIECRVRPVKPARVSRPTIAPKDHDSEEYRGYCGCKTKDTATAESTDKEQNLSISVMLSKPILALEFSCLRMQVEAPVVVFDQSSGSNPTSLQLS